MEASKIRKIICDGFSYVKLKLGYNTEITPRPAATYFMKKLDFKKRFEGSFTQVFPKAISAIRGSMKCCLSRAIKT